MDASKEKSIVKIETFKAFVNDWSKNSLETLRPGYQNTIGQRVRPSFYDVKIMNNAYCKGNRNYRFLVTSNDGISIPKRCLSPSCLLLQWLSKR